MTRIRFLTLALIALVSLCLPSLAGKGLLVMADEPEDRPLLLTHYMPWYQTPDVSGYWGWHWTMDHFQPDQLDANGRPEIASHFIPLTGPYDSQDEAVLEYQALLMKLSGIDGVIVDWYGTSSYADYATLNAATGKLFEVITRAGLRFAICYEDRTVLNMVNAGRLSGETAVAQGRAGGITIHRAFAAEVGEQVLFPK